MVWRVPKETSTESVARTSAAEISRMAATRAGSRVSPRVTSVGAAVDDRCGSIRAEDGGMEGEQDAARRTPASKSTNVFRGMLFYSGWGRVQRQRIRTRCE